MGDEHQRQLFRSFVQRPNKGLGDFSENVVHGLRIRLMRVRSCICGNELVGDELAKLSEFIRQVLNELIRFGGNAAEVYPRFNEIQPGWLITGQALQDLGFVLREAGGNFDNLNVDQLTIMMGWVFFHRNEPRMWAFPGGNGYFPENDRPPQAPRGPAGPGDDDAGRRRDGDGGGGGGARDEAGGGMRAGIAGLGARIDVDAGFMDLLGQFERNVVDAVGGAVNRGGQDLVGEVRNAVTGAVDGSGQRLVQAVRTAVAEQFNASAPVNDQTAALEAMNRDLSIVAERAAGLAEAANTRAEFSARQLRELVDTQARVRAEVVRQRTDHVLEITERDGEIARLGRVNVDMQTRLDIILGMVRQSRDALDTNNRTIGVHLQRIATLEGQLGGMEVAGLTLARFNALQTEILQLTGEIANVRAVNAGHMQRITELLARIDNESTLHRVEVERLRTALAAASGGGAAGVAAVAAVNDAARTSEAEIRRLQGMVTELQTENQRVGAAFGRALDSLQTTADTLDVRDAEVIGLRRQITEFQQRLGDMIPRREHMLTLAAARIQIRVARNARADFQRRFRELGTRFEDVNGQLAALRTAPAPVPAPAPAPAPTSADAAVLRTQITDLCRQLEEARKAVSAAIGGTGGDGVVVIDDVESNDVAVLQYMLNSVKRAYNSLKIHHETVVVSYAKQYDVCLSFSVNALIDSRVRGQPESIHKLENAVRSFFKDIDVSQLPSDGSFPLCDFTRGYTQVDVFHVILGVVKYISEEVGSDLGAVKFLERVVKSFGVRVNVLAEILRRGCDTVDFVPHDVTILPSPLSVVGFQSLGSPLADYFVLAFCNCVVIEDVLSGNLQDVVDVADSETFPLDSWVSWWKDTQEFVEGFYEDLCLELDRDVNMSELYSALIFLCERSARLINSENGLPFGYNVDADDENCFDTIDMGGKNDEDDEDELGGGADGVPPPPPPSAPPSAPAAGGAVVRGDLPMPREFLEWIRDRSFIEAWIQTQLDVFPRLLPLYTITSTRHQTEHSSLADGCPLKQVLGELLSKLNLAQVYGTNAQAVYTRTLQVLGEEGYTTAMYDSLRNSLISFHGWSALLVDIDRKTTEVRNTRRMLEARARAPA